MQEKDSTASAQPLASRKTRDDAIIRSRFLFMERHVEALRHEVQTWREAATSAREEVAALHADGAAAREQSQRDRQAMECELARVKADCSRLAASYDNIVGSRAWRITAPLRAARTGGPIWRT